MAEAGKQMADAMRTSVEAARKQGVPGADKISDADARKLQEDMQQAGKTAGRVAARAARQRRALPQARGRPQEVRDARARVPWGY